MFREVCRAWRTALHTPFHVTRVWQHPEVFAQPELDEVTQTVCSIQLPNVELTMVSTLLPVFYVPKLSKLRCCEELLPRLVFQPSSYIHTLEVFSLGANKTWYGVTTSVDHRSPDVAESLEVSGFCSERDMVIDHITTRNNITTHAYSLTITSNDATRTSLEVPWESVYVSSWDPWVTTLQQVHTMELSNLDVLLELSWFRCSYMTLVRCSRVEWSTPNAFRKLHFTECTLTGSIYEVEQLEWSKDPLTWFEFITSVPVPQLLTIAGRVGELECNHVRQLQFLGEGTIRRVVLNECGSVDVLSPTLTIAWWHMQRLSDFYRSRSPDSIFLFHGRRFPHLTLVTPAASLSTFYRSKLATCFEHFQIVQFLSSYEDFLQLTSTPFQFAV